MLYPEKIEATNHAAGTEGSGGFTGVVDDTQEHVCPNDVGDLEKQNMHKSGIFVIFPTLILLKNLIILPYILTVHSTSPDKIPTDWLG